MNLTFSPDNIIECPGPKSHPLFDFFENLVLKTSYGHTGKVFDCFLLSRYLESIVFVKILFSISFNDLWSKLKCFWVRSVENLMNVSRLSHEYNVSSDLKNFKPLDIKVGVHRYRGLRDFPELNPPRTVGREKILYCRDRPKLAKKPNDRGC